MAHELYDLIDEDHIAALNAMNSVAKFVTLHADLPIRLEFRVVRPASSVPDPPIVEVEPGHHLILLGDRWLAQVDRPISSLIANPLRQLVLGDPDPRDPHRDDPVLGTPRVGRLVDLLRFEALKLATGALQNIVGMSDAAARRLRIEAAFAVSVTRTFIEVSAQEDARDAPKAVHLNVKRVLETLR